MRVATSFRVLFSIVIAAPLCLSTARGQETYKNYEDAFSQGARLLRDKQVAASQAPLEAALRLAPDDKARLNTYQALLPAYRMLPEIDKMLEACDFVIRHSDRKAARSIASRDVVSFLHQRGKVDVGIERYEAKLKEDPNDVAALAVLFTIYTRLKRDENRGAELTTRLEDANRKLARQVAERNEKDAEAAPRTASWHLKDAAVAWLEAGDKTKALAAAKKSASGPGEQRSAGLTFYWREALGDVFLQTGEPALAAVQYEAAKTSAITDSYRQKVEKKLEEAKAASSKK